MLLNERLAENVRACFTGIWIQSHEHDEALLEITRLCHSEDWGCVNERREYSPEEMCVRSLWPWQRAVRGVAIKVGIERCNRRGRRLRR